MPIPSGSWQPGPGGRAGCVVDGGGAGGATVVGVGTVGCGGLVDGGGVGRSGSGVFGRQASHVSFGLSVTGLSLWSFPPVGGGLVGGGTLPGGGGATGRAGSGSLMGGRPGISGRAGWRSQMYRWYSVRPSFSLNAST